MRKFITSIFFVTIFFSACKKEETPLTAQDTAPVVASFIATPSTVDVNKLVLFTVTSSDAEGLDSIVIDFLDGSKKTFISGRKISSLDTVSHLFSSVKKYEPTATAYADGKVDAKTVAISVMANPPPVIADSLNGSEGFEKRILRSSFASSPQGRQITLQLVSADPSISITLTTDSIKVKGINADINGIFNSIWKASDDKGNVTQKSVITKINPSDDIVVSVSDFLAGTMSDSMAIKGPFTSGKGVIDGVVGTLKSDGTFSFPKLSNSAHAGSFWVTNGKDSSYVAKYSIPKGDGSFNAKVYSNAGSGMNMKLLFDFFDQANFQSDRTTGSGGLIKGINFNDAVTHSFWIAQLDTLFQSNQYAAFTPQQQATVKGWLESEILKYIPVSKQPVIYLASFGEKWPAGIAGTTSAGYGSIVNLKRSGGVPGLFQTYDPTRDGILDASILSVAWSGPESRIKSAFLQENLSALAAPFAVGGLGAFLDIPLANKTCLHENAATNYLTPIDVKLLLIPAYVGSGKKALDYFGMPQ